VEYQDGTSRARTILKDSYGNPVSYDSLEDVDAKRPSRNKENPFMYVIPGYASGILQPHELPPRSSSADNPEARGSDDRIHFVDPLVNAYEKFNRIPSTSLTAPGVDSNTQTPIDIPRPNIDLNETPEVPIVDPLNQPLSPPTQPTFFAVPSTSLSFPLEDKSSDSPQLSQGLTPPEIPSTDGVFIPRPNLNEPETPIDNTNDSPLNQGLLPPSPTSQDDSGKSLNNGFSNNIFLNPTQNIPVIITDDQTRFAPKPSNGLLPPKDPSPNEVDFQAPPTQSSANFPSTSTKFTGTFTGSLSGDTTPKRTQQPSPPSFQIPVQVIVQSPKESGVNKYQGGFGGSPGVLVSSNNFDRVAPTLESRIDQTFATVPSTTTTKVIDNRFSGNFGGSQGVLGGNPTAQTLSQVSSTQKVEKYTGQFGGPSGVLTPFDNKA
jgi:hypothetical protein